MTVFSHHTPLGGLEPNTDEIDIDFYSCSQKTGIC